MKKLMENWRSFEKKVIKEDLSAVLGEDESEEATDVVNVAWAENATFEQLQARLKDLEERYRLGRLDRVNSCGEYRDGVFAWDPNNSIDYAGLLDPKTGEEITGFTGGNLDGQTSSSSDGETEQVRRLCNDARQKMEEEIDCLRLRLKNFTEEHGVPGPGWFDDCKQEDTTNNA